MESSRTDFEVLGLGLEGQVLGLGLEASSSQKLACPRLEDSSMFWIVKILWSAWKIFGKRFFVGIAWKIFVKTFSWRPFFFFFGEHLRLCPWSLALASSIPVRGRVSVLGKAVLGLGLGFFLCPWPWPRALCSRLHLWTAISLPSSINTNGYINYIGACWGATPLNDRRNPQISKKTSALAKTVQKNLLWRV